MISENDMRLLCHRYAQLRARVPNGLQRDPAYTGAGVVLDGTGEEVCIARQWDRETNGAIADLLVFAANLSAFMAEVRLMLHERECVRGQLVKP